MFQQQVTASGDVKMSRNSVLLVTEHEIVGALEMLLGLFFFSITKTRLRWNQMSE